MSQLGGKKVRWIYENKTTTCAIYNQDSETIVFGEAVRYAKDTNDKRVARKVSFQRAMKRAADMEIIPKSERQAIWVDFLTTINQPLV